MKHLELAAFKRLETAKKNARSTFLSMLMKNLSGSLGDDVINNATNGNVEAFSKAWAVLSNNLTSQVSELSVAN